MPLDLATLLARVPVCEDFAPAARAGLARFGTIVTLAPGANLIRQGRAADAVFALLDGELEIRRRLPGGGELALGNLLAPALVGELGFVVAARRTADVRARGAVTVMRWERRLLDAACTLQDATALEFTQRVVARIAALGVQLLERIGAEADTAPITSRIPAPPPAVPDAPFEHAMFFALLDPFQGLDAALRDALLAMTEARSHRAGERLQAAGDTSDGIVIVVRGALELRPPDGRPLSLQILGPGALAGLPAILLDMPHSVSCHAREQSEVRWLSRATFAALYTGSDRLGLVLRAIVAAAVAGTALALSNRLAQYVGLHRAQAVLARRA